jgi:four helix bundle protein
MYSVCCVMQNTSEGVAPAQNRAVVLKSRSKKFAIQIVRLYGRLKSGDETRTIGRQLLRSGTSVAANYRAVCRARSKAEFIAKVGVVVEEADETVFWLELLLETGLVPRNEIQPLLTEAGELLAIFAASQHTAKQNHVTH